MEKYDLKPEELLVVDDLKPGYDMAHAAGVPLRQQAGRMISKKSKISCGRTVTGILRRCRSSKHFSLREIHFPLHEIHA